MSSFSERIETAKLNAEESEHLVDAEFVKRWQEISGLLSQLTEQISDEEVDRWARIVCSASGDEEIYAGERGNRKALLSTIALYILNANEICAMRRAGACA